MTDDLIFNLDTQNFKTAFDIIFKLYYIFNAKFPTTFSKLFNFFETVIYKIKNVSAFAAVDTFYTSLLNS